MSRDKIEMLIRDAETRELLLRADKALGPADYGESMVDRMDLVERIMHIAAKRTFTVRQYQMNIFYFYLRRDSFDFWEAVMDYVSSLELVCNL